MVQKAMVDPLLVSVEMSKDGAYVRVHVKHGRNGDTRVVMDLPTTRPEVIEGLLVASFRAWGNEETPMERLGRESVEAHMQQMKDQSEAEVCDPECRDEGTECSCDQTKAESERTENDA